MNDNENKNNTEELTKDESSVNAAGEDTKSALSEASDESKAAAASAVKAPEKDLRKNQKADSKEPGKPATMNRKMKRGLASLIITVLVIIAVVLANAVASVMTSKLPALTADITGMKNFVINEKTREIVQNLKRKVTISFLSDRDTYTGIDPYCKQTAVLAEEMQKCSDGMINVEYVDIVRNPSFVENFDADDLKTTDIIITSGTNRKILRVADMFTFENYSGNLSYIASSKAEQEIDNAVLSVSTSEMIKTAIIIDNASEDRSFFENTLKADGYSVTEIVLSSQIIPEDTQMVVLYTPSKDLSQNAVSKLRTFLENNGNYGKNLLYIASPTDIKEMPNLDALLLDYGMSVGNGFVFEADGTRINSSSQNYFDGVLCSYASDLYTENISDISRTVIAGYAKPVLIKDPLTAAPLLKYSEYSGICPFDADENWSYKDAIVGNVPILAQGTIIKDDKYSSVIVSGCERIFARSYYGSDYSNRTYLSTMLATVNGRTQELVSIPEKVITAFDIEIDHQTAANLGFIVYAVIPLIILGAGFTVFLMRRNR